MASFSTHSLRAIEAFTASLGLPPQPPARDGSFTFVFERSGKLSLTPTQDGERALVSLARMPERTDAGRERRALARAGFNPTTGRYLHAGLAGDGSLIFAIALDDGAFDLPTLEACLQELVAAHQDVA